MGWKPVMIVEVSVLHHVTTQPPHLYIVAAECGTGLTSDDANGCNRVAVPSRNQTLFHSPYFNPIIYTVYVYELQALLLAYISLHNTCHAIKQGCHKSYTVSLTLISSVNNHYKQVNYNGIMKYCIVQSIQS